MNGQTMYYYEPLSEVRITSDKRDSNPELYDLPERIAVLLAALLHTTPRIRYEDAAIRDEYVWRLLMPATQRIVDEIRALRDGASTSITDREQVNPYEVTATSLKQLAQSEEADTDLLVQILAVLAG